MESQAAANIVEAVLAGELKCHICDLWGPPAMYAWFPEIGAHICKRRKKDWIRGTHYPCLDAIFTRP